MTGYRPQRCDGPRKTTGQPRLGSAWACLAVGLLSFVASTAIAQGAGGSLLPNGSFEQLDAAGQPVGWQLRAGGPAVVAQVAAGQAPDGKYSLLLASNRPAGWRAMSRAVRVQGGRWYLVRWMCKTEDVDGGASVAPIMANPVRIDGVSQAGTRGWTPHEYLLYVPSEQSTLQLSLMLRGRGRAWFDKIELVPTQVPSRTAPGLDDCFYRLPQQGGCELAFNYPPVKVFYTDAWPEGRQVERLALELARNEYEALQLLIRPTSDARIEEVVFEGVGQLKLSWNWVGVVHVPPAAVHDVDGRPGPNPDPLYPPVPLDVKAGNQAILWIRAYAPKDCRPGEHDLTVRLRGSVDISLPMRIHVWDLELPAKPTLRSFANLQIRARGKWASADRAAIERQLLDTCRSHGITPTGMALKPLEDVQWVRLNADGTVTIDFEAFDRAIEAYRAQGFDQFFMHPRNFRARGGGRGERRVHFRKWLGLTPLTDAFDKAFSDYCRKMARHLREKGWIRDAIWYPWDEPNEREYDSFERMVRLIKDADRELVVSVAGARLPLERFYGLVDIWSTNLRWYDVNTLADRIKERLAAGDDVGGYGNNRYQLQFPLVWVRTWPWVLYRWNLRHCGWWSVVLWIGDVWQGGLAADLAQPHETGAGCWLYPPPFSGATICESLRWEALRDGVEDYEYLSLFARVAGPEEARRIAGRIVQGNMAWQYERDISALHAIRRELAERIEAAN